MKSIIIGGNPNSPIPEHPLDGPIPTDIGSWRRATHRFRRRGWRRIKSIRSKLGGAEEFPAPEIAAALYWTV